MSTPEVKEEISSEIPQTPVKEVEETKEIAPEAKEAGTSGVPQQVTPQVSTVTPTPTPTPSAPTVTITIPATPQQLNDWSKGSPDDSITWLAFYWIRMVKKAFFYGWRVITGGPPQPATQ